MDLRPAVVKLRRAGQPTLSWEHDRHPLGAGGYGTVYAADPLPRPPGAPRNQRSLAIKLQTIFVIKGRRYRVAAIQAEIDAMRACAHARVATLLHAFTSDPPKPTHFYMVMPLAPGTLIDVAERFPQGSIPRPVLRLLMEQLFDGINFCHSQLICHRDIKMGNVLVADMVNFQGVLITDFGIAQQFRRAPMMRDSIDTGTVYYAAPECFSGFVTNPPGRGYDCAKVDVFAAGITMAALLDHAPRGRMEAQTLLAGAGPQVAAQNALIMAANRASVRQHVQVINAWLSTLTATPYITPQMRRFLNCVCTPSNTRRHNAAEALAHRYFH